jgi:mannitol operon transcriptional antiterminator
MKLKEKEFKILQSIINNNAITLQLLSEEHKISTRTIRHYISSINYFLEENGFLKMTIKQNIINVYNKNEIQQRLLYVQNHHSYIMDAITRQKYLLITLLCSNTINISQFAKKLGVSRGTVKNDFETVKHFLDNKHLDYSVTINKGINLQQNENLIRMTALQAFNSCTIDEFNILIEDMFPIVEHKQDINNFLNKFKYQSSETLKLCYMCIIFSFIRAKQGYHLEYLDNLDAFKDSMEYKIGYQPLNILSEKLNIALNMEDKLKIIELIIFSNDIFNTDIFKYIFLNLEIICKAFLLRISSRFNKLLIYDIEMLELFLQYMKAMIFRVKNNIPLVDTIINDVLESYKEVFDIVKETLSFIEVEFNIKIPDDEIAFIVMYVNNFLDQSTEHNTSKKVYLVCHLGAGIAKFLEKKITTIFNVKVIQVFDYNSFVYQPMKHNNQIDYCITTINLPNSKYPQINISAVFSRLDEITLLNAGFDKNNELYNPSQNSKRLYDFLPEQNIIILDKANNWDDIVDESFKIFKKENFHNKDYIISLKNMIQSSSRYMLVDDKVLFSYYHSVEYYKVSHLRFDKSIFALIIVKEPVVLPSGVEINMFLNFVSHDNKEHIRALLDFMRLLSKKQFLESCKNSYNPAEIYQFILKNC